VVAPRLSLGLDKISTEGARQYWAAKSMRNPCGIVCEEAIDETHLVDDENAERQTYESRDQSEAPINARKPAFGKRKGHSNRCGN